MKIKLISAVVLSVLILPVLSGAALAACTGTCIDKDACAAQGGTSTPGLCPGAANIQCCVVAGTKTDSGSEQKAQTNTITSAQTTSGSAVEIPNPLKVKTIPDLINNIVDYLIGIATLLLPLVIVYAAYLFMSAGGDMEKVVLGRKTLTYAIVGYILILISKGVVMIVANILGAK